MRKLSEIGKSFTKRRNESVDWQSPTTDGERMSQSSSDEHKSRDSIEIVKATNPPPQTPERKGRSIEKGQIPRPSGSPEPVGRLSLSNEIPGSPATNRAGARLSDPSIVSGHEASEEEGKGKFRSIKRLSLMKGLRSKELKPADKRVFNWILSFPQFSVFASKFNFTTWEQLLGYTSEDLSKLGLPMNAVVPLSKIIAVLAEESSMEKGSTDSFLLQVPETRPRSFSYTNRAIATSEHVKTLEEIFQELDKENKGFINESELSVALQRYGVVDQEGAKAWFADIDNSQRGLIDQQQFVDYMTYVYPLIFQTQNPVWSPRMGPQGEPPTIFLGGSCNPTSWRKDIVIPLLQKASISFFNPQVDEWHEALIAIEARAKASATLLFFVIDSLTLSLATMIECTELITSGRPLVLVINDLPPDAKLASGEPMPPQLIKDANRARAYMADVAVRHRIQPYCSISRAACELIQFLHGGWTGGGYESTRPRSTLAKKSEESWSSLKQKVQVAIGKMNAGRRGSLRGSVTLPEPSALSLPPPRTPDRPATPASTRSNNSETQNELPLFSGAPLHIPSSPTGQYGMGSPHGSCTPGSPPSSPSKMIPVSLLGNFHHLSGSPPLRSTQIGGSPPLRPTNRSGSLNAGDMRIPIPALPLSPPARMASCSSSSESRSLSSESNERRGHGRAGSSISSLADIAEGAKLEDLADAQGPSLDLVEMKPCTTDGTTTTRDSPRSSNASNPDLNESPQTTPLGSTPSSFLSLSPANSGPHRRSTG